MFGAAVVGLIPRMIVGGVLVFVGLSFLVAWVCDKRRSLPVGEYVIVLAILVTIATKGLLPGVVVGLVLAVVLFAVNYGRIELVREVAFGTRTAATSTALRASGASCRDRPTASRSCLLNGFVFFGTASGLLERIRKRVEAGPIMFLVVDLRRVTGIDASAVLSFSKAARLAEASGFELVFAGASDDVQAQLRRGGVVAADGVVRFEAGPRSRPAGVRGRAARGRDARSGRGRSDDSLAGLPAHLRTVPRAEVDRRGDGADPPRRSSRATCSCWSRAGWRSS